MQYENARCAGWNRKRYLSNLCILCCVLGVTGICGPSPARSGTEEKKSDIKTLIRSLNSERWVYTQWNENKAVQELAKIGQPAVEPLIQALSNKNERIRFHAAVALGEIGDVTAVEPLIAVFAKYLPEKYDDTPGGAAWALGRMKDKRAIEPLANALITMLDKRQSLAGVSVLEDERYDATADALLQFDDPALTRLTDPLIGYLEYCSKNRDAEQPDDLGYAVRLLGHIKASRAVEPLVALLSGEDAYLREQVVRVSGRPDSDIYMLALEYGDAELRECVVRALGSIGGLQTRQPLIDALKYSESALDVLIGIGITPTDSLVEMLKDKDSLVVKRVASSLGRIGDVRCVSPLIAVMRTRDKIAANAAVDALRVVLEKRKDTVTRESLDELIKESSAQLRGNKIEKGKLAGLFGIIGKPAIPYLMEVMSIDDDPIAVAYAAISCGNVGLDGKEATPLIIKLFPTISGTESSIDNKGQGPRAGGIVDYRVERVSVDYSNETISKLLKNNSEWYERGCYVLASRLQSQYGTGEYLAISISGRCSRYKFSNGSTYEVFNLTARYKISAAAYALSKITGVALGDDKTKWQDWWESGKGK